MSRCSICPNKYRCVPGDGPTGARVFCIGEAPGKTEDAGGRPFIGDAGREFNENYLNLAGLCRDEIYITNTVKCRPDLNRKPTITEVNGCSQHFLPEELQEINPEIVMLMGATPCSLMPEKIDLEAEHGIPRLGELFGWYGWIVPINHPDAGLHDSTMMIPMLEDWERLYRWLEYGEWQWPIDDAPRDYGLIETRVEMEDYLHVCSQLPMPLLIGGDTESHARQPYSWQVSMEPYVARMVMLKNEKECRFLASWLGYMVMEHKARFVFHNAPADLPIFENQLRNAEALYWQRVYSLDGCYRDTMQESYHLTLPQGLKPLSRRLLGRQRLSWEETVTPYSKEILGAWMQEGFVYAEQNWQTVNQTFHKKTGKPNKPKVIKSNAEKLLVELYGYMLNNPDYKIWEKYEERMPEADKAWLSVVLGPVPQRGIAHCPKDVQVWYGCSDPDDTRQLALLFEGMRKEFIEGLNFQEEDADDYIQPDDQRHVAGQSVGAR